MNMIEQEILDTDPFLGMDDKNRQIYARMISAYAALFG